MDVLSVDLLRWEEVHGTVCYGSILSSAIQQGKRGDRAGSRWVYNFKRYSKKADQMELIIRSFAAYMQCEDILVVPGHTPEETSLQALFGSTLERTQETEPRKYQHTKPLPDDYEESYRIHEDQIQGDKVLLVDDICTSGASIRHFKQRLQQLGLEVHLFALGLDHKLDIQDAGRTLIIAQRPQEEKKAKPAQAKDELSNPRQVYLHLKDRYKVGEKTIYRHVEEGRLKPKRGGGFAVKTVEAYAKSNFTPLVDDPQDQETDNEESAKAMERRQLADAQLKEEQAKRAKMGRLKEEGKLVKTEILEEELVTRARIFSLGLENFFQEHMPEVIERIGGSDAKAREIIDLTGGSPESSETLVQWFQSRVPDLIAYFLEQKEDWLHSYATGAWYTEEMAQAVEKWKANMHSKEERI